MDRFSQLFTVVHNRICEQADLMGFFYHTSYEMPDYPMVHRSDRIDQPVKPDRMENSANSSATRSASQCLWRRHSARHGRNPHSSGIFTFFSFEEGSNFAQNSRQYRTSFSFRRESFLFTLPAATHIPPHRLRPHQTIERTQKRHSHIFFFDQAAGILYLLNKIQVIFTV